MWRKLLLFILCLFCKQHLPAQTFEWIKQLHGNRNDAVKSLTVLPDNSIVFAGDFKSTNISYDTTQLANFENINTSDGFLIRINSNGTLIWKKQILGANENFIYKIVSDVQSNIYVIGTATNIFQFDTSAFIPKFLNRTRIFILKLDSNGNLLKKQAFNSTNSNGIFPGTIEVDANKNIYFTITNTRNDSVYLDGGIIPKQGNTSCLVKLNENFQLVWTLPFFQNNYSATDLKIDSQGSIYMCGTYNSSLNIGGQTLLPCFSSNNNSYLSKISPLGAILWLKCQGTATTIGGNINPKIALFENEIFLAGTFSSQIKLDSNLYLPSSGNFANIFILKTSQNGQIIWAKRGLSGTNSSNNVKSIKIYNSEKIFILSQHAGGNFIFDTIQNSAQIGNNSFGLIQKLNSNGNMTYSFEISSPNTGLNEIAIDQIGNAYIGGFFSGNISFINNNLFSSGENDGFILKLPKYTIIPEPQTYQLCTYDSIQIPYTSYGKYQANNVFTLELSDTNGVFLNQNNLVIGQRQDSLSGIIYAKIPNNIHASNKYKMRIKSSHPLVVSDYDSNYFNIQPKAFAHAGSDTLQCFGQQLLLGSNQSNAQNYLWSPASFLTDRSAKFAQTFARAGAGKVNFILKASNQHCLAFDTTTVTFLAPLTIQFTNDTSLCYLDSFALKPIVLGGDSSLPKNLSWYANSFDSLAFVGSELNSQLSTNTNFYLIATDACSLPDTNEVSVQILRANKLLLPQDTALCAGQTLRLSPHNLLPDSPGYTLNWTDSLFNSISVADTLVLNLNQSQKNYLISSHVCNALPDTAAIHITQYQVLQIQISSDSIVCRLDTLAIKILLSGGNPAYYKATWSNGQTDSSTQFVFDAEQNQYQYTYKTIAQSSTKMYVTISDNCATPITDTVSILTHLPLTFAIQKNDVCEGKPTHLFIKTEGGKNPFNYTWQSLTDRTIISDKDTLYLQSAQDTSFFITLTDACKQTDTLIYDASFFPNPKASFKISDLQYYPGRTALSLSNTSLTQGTSKYLWRIDGSTSLEENPSTIFYTSGIKNISLWLSNQYNCSDSASIDTLILVNQESEIFMPNAIHLSGTGLNETFEPIGLNIASYQLKIYNRWNILVYETNQNNAPFNGKDQSGNELPAEVYFYTLNLETTYGKTLQKSGNVTVIR